jgi:5-methylcytosine-specific restriction endonuclease McrA
MGSLTRTSKLKMRLFAAGLKAKKCEVCNREKWNGGPIPLELDHINGRREDNRLENLRIVCPNCHAQTDTYRGRNIGASGRYPVR